MTFQNAIRDFVNLSSRFSDYWSMQFAWSCYVDGLAKDKQITEKQYSTWSNPCTPETFERWSNKWYGLRRAI